MLPFNDPCHLKSGVPPGPGEAVIAHVTTFFGISQVDFNAAMAGNITFISKREKAIALWSSGYRNQVICPRLSVHPAESLTNENLLRTLNYVMYMSGVDPSVVHFFDKSSVVKTIPNQSYGHSRKGLPAVEVQQYTSNCNYTVNLLHSRFGIDNFNILEGPSNGFKMIHFFEESLQAVDHVGNPVLANGNVVVMDNCGFYHGDFAENQLHLMLRH